MATHKIIFLLVTPTMDFQNNFKIMKIKKSLIVLSIFISYSLTGQEENLMNIFTNDASIGINMSIVSDISNNNTDKINFLQLHKTYQPRNCFSI
ncbi:MAG: hypothetical protein CM15mP23_15080 [Cryomorphaceae bacterium]|nr:MAG: hypothetical protein CM15mP23_15080 [Cryomorphaceae bacterium]